MRGEVAVRTESGWRAVTPQTAITDGAEIATRSVFDRKNYFYPDLPQGYQISQLYHPIVGEGEVLVEMGPGVARLVRIAAVNAMLASPAPSAIIGFVPRQGPQSQAMALMRSIVATVEVVS